jgi:hypothetical protein
MYNCAFPCCLDALQHIDPSYKGGTPYIRCFPECNRVSHSGVIISRYTLEGVIRGK